MDDRPIKNNVTNSISPSIRVTSLKNVGNSPAFEECNNLTLLIYSGNISSISERIVERCKKMFNWENIWNMSKPFLRMVLIILIGHFIIVYLVKMLRKMLEKSKNI